MLNLKKPQNISMYQRIPLEHGLTQEKSNISQQKEVTEDISLMTTDVNKILPLQTNEQKSSILEFHLENNQMIYSDKQNILKINTQTIHQSQISDQVLTLKDQDSKGFWKESLMEQSKKLWLPTKTDLAGLDIHYLNGFSNNIIQNSFVIKNQMNQKNKNYQMTSWLSSLYSQPDTMERENIKKINYSRKVRFYPTTKHKNLLEKCFNATRFLINKALEHIKNGNITKLTNHIEIRNYLRYQDKYLNNENSWLKEIPYDTRDLAIRQLCSNFKTALSQLKKGTIRKFKMNFKSKKNPNQVCFVNKNAFNVNKNTLFVRRVKDKIKIKENMNDYEFGTLTIKREKNRYYMCFPLKRNSSYKKTPYKAVSLDPGVKTFQTFYSEEGLIGKIGDGIYNKIKNINLQIDKLSSNIPTSKNKKKYNLRKRCFLLRTKVKNIISDLHKKTCSWLTSNFKYIFLPTFNVKPMIKKKGRNISKSVVRSMLSLSHYSFKQRLLDMASSRCCIVNICNESYTSKTCGKCGFLNNKLGGDRMFYCNMCGLNIDRDYNGARNIYLKNIRI